MGDIDLPIWVRRLIQALVMLLAALIAGPASILLLYLLPVQLGLYSPVIRGTLNWHFGAFGIGVGVITLILGLYLGSWRWKAELVPGELRKAVVVRLAIVGALIGIGFSLSVFSLAQLGLALIISWIAGH